MVNKKNHFLNRPTKTVCCLKVVTVSKYDEWETSLLCEFKFPGQLQLRIVSGYLTKVPNYLEIFLNKMII